MYVYVWVGGLRNEGTRSKVAAQVEAQVHVCTGVGGRAADSMHEKRSGSAGRCTQVHCAQWWVARLQIAGTKSAVAAQVRGRFEDTGIARECDEISSMGTAATIDLLP